MFCTRKEAQFFWDMTIRHWVIGSQHFRVTARILDHTIVKASKFTWQGNTMMRSLGKKHRNIARPGC
jgi:hypothetical protein